MKAALLYDYDTTLASSEYVQLQEVPEPKLVNDTDEPSPAPTGCLQVVASGKASGVNRHRLDNSVHTAPAML